MNPFFPIISLSNQVNNRLAEETSKSHIDQIQFDLLAFKAFVFFYSRILVSSPLSHILEIDPHFLQHSFENNILFMSFPVARNVVSMEANRKL